MYFPTIFVSFFFLSTLFLFSRLCFFAFLLLFLSFLCFVPLRFFLFLFYPSISLSLYVFFLIYILLSIYIYYLYYLYISPFSLICISFASISSVYSSLSISLCFYFYVSPTVCFSVFSDRKKGKRAHETSL